MEVRIEFDATAHFSFVREMTKKEFEDFKAIGDTVYANDERRAAFYKRLIEFVNQENDAFDYIFHDTDIEDLEVMKET